MKKSLTITTCSQCKHLNAYQSHCLHPKIENKEINDLGEEISIQEIECNPYQQIPFFCPLEDAKEATE